MSGKNICAGEGKQLAAGKVAGPEGFSPDGGLDGNGGIDDGTLARTYGQVPGPVCLYGNPNRLYDKTGGSGSGSGSATKAAKKAPAKNGIYVNPQSSIKAADWVSKIAANKNVEDYFAAQMLSSDGLISLKDADRFVYPNNVVPKFWLEDWLTAFKGMDWELTTGVLEITVTKPASPPAAGAKPPIQGIVRPDLAPGEAVDNFTQAKALGQTGQSADKFAVEFGSTVPNGIKLNSGRMTIVIATQVKMVLGGKPGSTLSMTDDELVNTWFHEIACHAGRFHLGSGQDLHGDAGVEATTKDIDAWIPGNQTLSKVFQEIQGFLSPSKTPGP